jgi:hypothetical protein
MVREIEVLGMLVSLARLEIVLPSSQYSLKSV